MPRVVVVLVLGIFLFSLSARAQGSNTVSTVPASSLQGLLNALASKSNVVGLCLGPAYAECVASHPPNPSPIDTNIVGVLASLEVSTAPIGTSTGGFTYTFDSRLGTFNRSSESFGPLFAERSLTIGRGKLSTEFNWLHASYDTLGGFDMHNLDLRFVTAPTGYTATRAYATSDTYVGTAIYGVTDNLDVGVAVPWVRMTVGADVGFFEPTGEDISPGNHFLVMPPTSAAGLGDLFAFGKYRLWRQPHGGLAAEVALRFPTGDINSLRGLGVYRTSLSAIWSRGGNVSPHANVGYEIWSHKVGLDPTRPDVYVKDQVNYGVGLEIKANPRATVLIDVVGRRELHGGKMGYVRQEEGFDALVALNESLDVVSFAPGVKWNVGGRVLLSANVLASLANQGLRARVIPVVGFEWAF